MKEEILNYIKSDSYKAQDSYALAKHLIANNETLFPSFSKALFELEKEGLIAKNKKNQYNLIERMHMVRGVLDLKAAGYGFLLPEDKNMPDIYIPVSETLHAMNGDVCLVKYYSDRNKGKKLEGKVTKIIKHKYEILIGEVRDGELYLKNPPHDLTILVRENSKLKVEDHMLVKAKVVRYINQRLIECKVLEVLGSMDDPMIDIIEVIHAHDLNLEFPQEVLEEVQFIPSTIENEPKNKRIDLRNEIIFTIDGADTKDIDDAVSIKKIHPNVFELGVHIADVSYYVKEDSPLDKEAYARGTSVYLSNQVIPMLPRELSNGICSLNPAVERFAISCIMQISTYGEVLQYDIFPSIIKSRHQMTYSNVNKIIAGDIDVTNQYQDIQESVFLMQELASVLGKIRSDMGSINFETIEPKIIFNEDGEVKDIEIRERGISENIIEEFMLVANQVIASHFYHADYPFIYRIHELPDSEKIKNVFELAKELGYLTSIPSRLTHQDLQNLLVNVKNTPYEKVITTMMLRSMAKAKYSENNLGHYGLAFDDYTHFTSPIRRYPDLIVHRLIRAYLFDKKLDSEFFNHEEMILPDIADQTSKMERNAMMAEREVLDIKKAEYMESHLGEIFEGVISSITRFGMFIELPNTVEGLVHISTLDDYYEFIEEKMMYLGKTNNFKYTIGMLVKVKLINVSKSLGRIDFELVK